MVELSDFFEKHNKIAVAFSGGADSAFLLYAAIQYADKVKAYYVKSAFQPNFELEDALNMADFLHADIKVIFTDILSSEEIVSNPADRCYYCKKMIFTAIAEAAAADGYSELADGTNASDDASDRPGMRALKELSVYSPLRDCGFTKSEIRRLSKEAGLFTWDKPAYACLATRIPTDSAITANKLAATQAAESYMSSLGFNDFRIRMLGDSAKIQVNGEQIDIVLKKKAEIVKELKKYYSSVMLDLEARNE